MSERRNVIGLASPPVPASPPAPPDARALLASVDRLTSTMIYHAVRHPDGTREFRFLSDSVRRLYGASPAEVMADPTRIYGRVHPDDRARLLAEEEEAHRSGTVLRTTLRMLNPDGSTRWSTFVSTPTLLPDGASAWDGVEFDVTDHVRVEEALRARSAELDTFFSSALDLLWIGDAEGRPLRLNAEWERTLGYPIDALMGRPFPDLAHEEDRPATREAMERLGRGEVVPTFTNRLRCRDGSYRAIEWRALPVGDLVVASARDVTERLEAEAALREADRRKDEFLAALSHELRNPLGAIRNGLAVLGRSPLPTEESRRALAILERQSAHLGRLVDDLLDVNRISRGKIRLRREPLDLGDLVRRAVEDHRSAFAAAAVALDLRESGAPCWVDGDPTRLVQVIGNLLVNALKFTPAGGRVELTLAPGPAGAELRVRDTGVGMTPEVLRQVFEPFVQATQPLDRSAGGLGLGLALVKGLVEQHGGSVTADSAGPGTGAEVTVALPLAESPEPTPVPAPPVALPSAPRRRVLIIEDNLDAAESLRDLLEILGHEVRLAGDGPRGVTAAREQRPEVVLCDLGLPGMTGFEVAAALRADAALAGATLVALTGYARPEDRRRALEAGFTLHLAKPVSLEVLQRVLAGDLP